MLWTLFGALFGGSEGLYWATGFMLIAIVLNLCFGDKFIHFLLNAKEVSTKSVSLNSMISNYSCTNNISKIRLFKCHSEHVTVCMVRSLVSSRSLIVSESLLDDDKDLKILSDVINAIDINRNLFSELALVLSYQVLMPGYLLNKVSRLLGCIYFYLFYPLLLLKNTIVSRTQKAKVLNRYNKLSSKNKVNRPIVNDLVFDYGIIESTNIGIWDYMIKDRVFHKVKSE